MNKRILRTAENILQLIIATIFIKMGIDKFLLHDVLGHTLKVGFWFYTNANTSLWYIFTYSFYMLAWLFFYFGIYKRMSFSLHQKIIYGLIAALGFTVLHSGAGYLLLLFIQSAGDSSSQITGFKIIWDPLNALYSWYIMLALISFAFWATFQFLQQYRELAEVDRLQSELSHIRSQIRPHFFFNTLNNMYAMALKSGSPELCEGLQNMTGIMRYTLEHTTEKMAHLSREWDYIRRYIAIQKLRFNEDDVRITVTANTDLKGISIGPMILINFVENAFKHGISLQSPSYIEIDLSVVRDHIRFNVRNSCHQAYHDTDVTGIGTEQTRNLLNLYYKDDYRLDINQSKCEYSVSLKLPKLTP